MTKNRKEILDKVINFVKEHLKVNDPAHDFWHAIRVMRLARQIAKKEGKNKKLDYLAIDLASLLHDVADYKFHQDDLNYKLNEVRNFLKNLDLDESTINLVMDIIKNISFKGKAEKTIGKPLEFYIVQDADRLDAIGAIGIARTFSYGGFKNKIMYDPNQKPRVYKTEEEYVKSDSSTINHFYEKLLL